MLDIEIRLENRPGALAEVGEALGRAGVSIEGGGAWVVNGKGAAHFLVVDGEAARAHWRPRASRWSPCVKWSYNAYRKKSRGNWAG